MDAFCMKCRAKREIRNSTPVTFKNGKPATRGTCPVCGTTVVRIGKAETLPAMDETPSVREIEVGGVTRIHDQVIAAVVAVAARNVDGVSSLGTASFRRPVAERVGGTNYSPLGVAVEAGQKEAILDLQLKVLYGFRIPEVVINVRRNVTRRVLELFGIVAKEINIKVIGIEFPRRAPGRVE